MSNQIRRYTLIIDFLKKRKYATKKEILEFLNETMQEDIEEKEIKAAKNNKGKKKLRTGLSERNIDRDIKALRKNGFAIEYNFHERKYYIEEVSQQGEAYTRMLESLHLSQVLNLGTNIQLEKVSASGYQYLFAFMDAISNKKAIEFHYQKFNEDTGSFRKLAPYLIKEFRRRLYVIGKDYKDNRVKTFAFDRMKGAHVCNEFFNIDVDYSEYFKECFGIVNDHDIESEDIELKAYDAKVNYLKTQPLHESQEVKEDGDNYTIFKLKVKPTFDFVMEIMMHSHQLEVLKPKSLVDEIKWRLEDTLKFYDK